MLKTKINRAIMATVAFSMVATAITVTTLAYAADCSREDVVFYLKQGFSHDHVAKMCSGTEKTTRQSAPIQTQTTAPAPVTPLTSAPSASVAQIERNVYFRSAIKADKVELTPTQLIYTKNRDCIKYGIEDPTGFHDKGCVQTRTTIELANLKVIRAKRAIPFVGKAELVIAGTIQRQILNPQVLSAKQTKGIATDYSLTPSTLEIPLRSSVDPKAFQAQLLSLL